MENYYAMKLLFNSVLVKFDEPNDHIKVGEVEQLEGCIAPGLRSGMDCVIDSSKAYNYILDKISLAIRAGEDVYINITK